MKYTFLIILALASISLLSACGRNDSDHGHLHDEASPAPHAAERSATDDTEHGHGDDTHAHDAPETEAFYGDDATTPTEDAVVDNTGHSHDDDTHTQNGDEQDHDSTAEHGEDAELSEPHGHDH